MKIRLLTGAEWASGQELQFERKNRSVGGRFVQDTSFMLKEGRTMGSQLACTVPLARGMRRRDVLAFHGRDPKAMAERVGEASLHKGLIWRGACASLSIELGQESASALLNVDGCHRSAGDQQAFEGMVCRVLGVSKEIQDFEHRFRAHPQLGELIEAQSGLSVPATATPFEAIVWAIVGQQISVKAAIAIRRNLICAADLRHSNGLLCFPGAHAVATLDHATLRQCGLTAAKADALKSVAAQVLSGFLPLDDWLESLPADECRCRLSAIRGIGPWTVGYALLRGFGRLDGLLHGDAVARRGLQNLLKSTEKISEAEAKVWLEQFAPWSALAVAHIWAAQSLAA